MHVPQNRVQWRIILKSVINTPWFYKRPSKQLPPSQYLCFMYLMRLKIRTKMETYKLQLSLTCNLCLWSVTFHKVILINVSAQVQDPVAVTKLKQSIIKKNRHVLQSGLEANGKHGTGSFRPYFQQNITRCSHCVITKAQLTVSLLSSFLLSRIHPCVCTFIISSFFLKQSSPSISV